MVAAVWINRDTGDVENVAAVPADDRVFTKLITALVWPMKMDGGMRHDYTERNTAGSAGRKGQTVDEVQQARVMPASIARV